MRAFFEKAVNFKQNIMEIVAIQGQKKEKSGTTAAKQLRRSELVPAVMYQSGGGEAIQFAVKPSEFRHLVYTPQFKLAEITLDGVKHKCILKEIQFHPVTDTVIHIDFLKLVPGVKFKAIVPLNFVGQSPGVKAGGKFIATMRKVNILTTPEKVVDSLDIDISAMELGSTIRVRDIKPADGVEVTNNASVPVALIEIPRTLRQAMNK